MSYYTFGPGQIYAASAGFGALGGITFNGDQVWSDWVACDAAYRASQAAGTAFRAPASCQRAVDSMRAALGQLGYGGLNMGVAWGSGDQGAWKKWASDAGVAPSAGMPTKVGLQVMDEQIARGAKPGDEPAIEYEKVGDTYVEKKKLEEGADLYESGIDWTTWGLIGLGAAGVLAVAIVASKKKGKKAPPRARPQMSGPPSAVAAR